jgi:hypothetical protein
MGKWTVPNILKKEKPAKLPKFTVVKLAKSVQIEMNATVGQFWKRMEALKNRELTEDTKNNEFTNFMADDVESHINTFSIHKKRAKYAIIRQFLNYNEQEPLYDVTLLSAKGIVLGEHYEQMLTDSDQVDSIKTLKLAKAKENIKKVRFSVGKLYLDL